MLQLNNPIRLHKFEKKHLRFLKADHGGAFTVNSWSDGKVKTTRLKSRISLFLLTQQDYRCVYCQRLLIGVSKAIDHIAPKTLHPEYTFEPYNLALACTYCNENGRKGFEETISVKRAWYSANSFLIVHPYLDNVDFHIRYQDPERIYLNYQACSNQGQFTCDMFDLHGIEMTELRSREYILRMLAPLPNQTLTGLIKNAVSYKKKP